MRTAFTLIELLVVIAIVALLVALLLPALSAARAVSQEAACLSNARQTAVAVLTYALDHDERVVPNRVHEPDNTVQAGRAIWWFGEEVGGLGGSGTPRRPLNKRASPLAPYFGGDILDGMACPTFPADDPRFFPKFSERSAHFGYNTFLAPLWHEGKPPRRLSDVPRPAGIVMFADAVHVDGFNYINGQEMFYEPHYLAHSVHPGWRTGFAHFRHRGTANLVMTDGHGRSWAVEDADEHRYDVIAGSVAANLEKAGATPSVYGR